MPSLYSSGRQGWIYQPNYVRRRHRFRGPRESLKINQEISQFIYDTNRLNDILDDNNTTLEANVETIVSGWDLDGIYVYNDSDATPSEQLIDFIGLDELISRVEQARRRVRILRGSNG